MDNFKLVLIEWVDSYSVYEQRDFIKYIKDPEIVKCKSVGFLIKETDESILILPHISNENEAGMGGICIPKISITKITEIYENTT
jgi:hypothetical protein